jgi:3',5'-cyclic AMP phosphodiesterase CpdA
METVRRAEKESFADFNRIKAGFKVPCYAAPGNHDVGGPPTAKTLQFYRGNVGKDYYSFTHEGYTFVIVNTQLWKEG